MLLAKAYDPERPSTTDSKFGAKSSLLNDNFKRPLMTMKTVKDTERQPMTGSDSQILQ